MVAAKPSSGDFYGLVAHVLASLFGEHFVDQGRLAVRDGVSYYGVFVCHDAILTL